MVPRDFLEYFDTFEVHEFHNEWQIILHEKESLIPDQLKLKHDIVLDGFCNPLQRMQFKIIFQVPGPV